MSARLGPPRQEARHKGEYGFYCIHPRCDSARHGKVRLWVNPDRDSFHCWHCGWGLATLAPLMVPGSSELREYLETRSNRADARQTIEERPRCTTLPPGFVPFGRRPSPEAAPYLTYLSGRGVTGGTVELYRMGYVDAGRLAGRVVVPSFDRFGMVNFWSARSIYPVAKIDTYRLPHATKDVISNEHMVDWTAPVYLVEGIFDEIAIGPQAISLYGKFMQPSLATRLVRERPPMTYVCLDDDARAEAWDLTGELMAYDLPCAMIELDGKDPSVVGRAGVEAARTVSLPVSDPLTMLRARIQQMSGSV